MFKQIYYNDKPTVYIICDDGVIYNTSSHNNLYGSYSNGYVYVQLVIEGKPISFGLHKLLATYFIPNPDNRTIVHHIDGNPRNNKLENLMWVTQEENCNMRLCVSPKVENTIPVFSEDELENEHWVQFRDTHYEVSDLGRKRNLYTGAITTGSQNKNSGYIRWALGKAEYQAHRAVYEAFHPGEEIKVINHIDGNRANNRLSNLENITASENTLKAFYETGTKKTCYVAQYDQDGNLIAIYPSAKKCAEALGVANGSVVRNSVLGNYNCRGFKLKFSTKEEYQNFIYKM